MYLDKTLLKDEKILVTAKLHWLCYIVPMTLIIFGLFTTRFGIGFVLLIAGIYGYLKNKTTEMVVTNKRVIAKYGIIGRDTTEIRTAKVESVRLKQSVFGRIFGYGDIVFTGTGNAITVFEKVLNPLHTKSQCENVIEK